jgi:hypothetical protein
VSKLLLVAQSLVMQCWLGLKSHRVKVPRGSTLCNARAWGAAVAELPAAVDELAAVSLQGPVKLVCFDLETTCCE